MLGCLFVLASVAGCSDDTVSTAERAPNDQVTDETPQPPVDDTVDPHLETVRACSDRVLNGHGFQVLSTDARSPVTDACGDVAFLDASGAAILWPIEASHPDTVAPSAKQLALSHKGKKLAYLSGDGKTLTSMGLGTRDAETFAVDEEALSFGYVETGGSANDETALVLCSADGGLRLAGSPTSSEPCTSLVLGHGPFAVARTMGDEGLPNGEVRVIDGRTGKVTSLNALTASRQANTRDAIELSDDGLILLFTQWEDAPTGDTFARDQFRVTVVDLTTNTSSEPIQLGVAPAGFTGATAYSVSRGGCSVALSHPLGFLCASPGSSPIVRDTKGLLAVHPAGDSGLFLGADPASSKTNATALLREPLTSAKPPQVIATAVGTVAGTDDFTQLVVGHIPTDGIRYPDNQGVSHAQLWNYSRVDEGGVHVLATSTQPLQPLWVDASGTSALLGALAEVPLPTVAAPEEVPPETYGLYLLSPNGDRIGFAEWGNTPILTRSERAVALETFVSGPSYRLVFATRKGIVKQPVDAAVLAQVRQRESASFDASGVAATIIGRGDGSARIILGGVVPGASLAGLD